jgi:hypothetical protein
VCYGFVLKPISGKCEASSLVGFGVGKSATGTEKTGIRRIPAGKAT